MIYFMPKNIVFCSLYNYPIYPQINQVITAMFSTDIDNEYNVFAINLLALTFSSLLVFA